MKVDIKSVKNNKVENDLKKLLVGKMRLKVGFLENSKYPNEDITTPEVAAKNEYGSINKDGTHIPPRPFMKQTVDKNEKKWSEIFEKKMIEFNLDIEKTLNFIGLIAMGDVKETIINGDFAPLSQYTIDKKGTNKPLIDTTHMLNSVDYEIDEGEVI